MRAKLPVAMMCAALCTTVVLCGSARQGESPGAGPMACRVLEAHTSAKPAVAVVIFHQQNKAEQQQLSALLRDHAGETMEIQAEDEKWIGVTVFRLKSCFGRGMLVLPPDGPAMKDGATFLLRLRPNGGKS